MNLKTGMGLVALALLPMQVFAAGLQAAVCHRGDFYFYFGPLAAQVGDHTVTSIWLKGGEANKKFGLGHVLKRSSNGDLVVLVADPSPEKPGPGSQIVYTAGLNQAVFVANMDPNADTTVAVADCTVKEVPAAKH